MGATMGNGVSAISANGQIHPGQAKHTYTRRGGGVRGGGGVAFLKKTSSSYWKATATKGMHGVKLSA